MNNIYLGLFLSLICVILAYFLLSKLLIVSLFCVILAAIYFKDDFSLFRYLATHVASFYYWIFESYYYLLNMYHQSNNTNFPVRKPLENNGTVSNKLHNRYKQNVTHNLTSLYRREASPHLNSSPSISPIPTTNKAHSLIKDIPNTNIGLTGTSKTQEENVMYNRLNQYSGSVKSSFGLSPHSSPLLQRKNDLSGSPMGNVYSADNSSGKVYSKVPQSPVDAKLYANVTSPGFCSRIAEGLSETMTHQTKYDSVGAFPVVHLTNQSPKIKIKTPVRVRIAPPTNELLYSGVANNSIGRTPVIGAEETMKSVLQVLKEISRKRIHSHIDDVDCEDNTKRLRIGEAQLSGQSMLQSSLLQQTIQGKRAREETSPSEDDFKKKRKPLQNNEILSSLSSSMAVKPPHLKTKKRKAPAIDDSISSTPVLGKLLKVQAEITPPSSVSQSLAPAPQIEDIKKNSPAHDSISQPKVSVRVSSTEATQVGAAEPVKTPAASAVSAKLDDDDSSVSRLLGRMSGHSERPVPPRDIPVTKDPFMTTNDLSLSPPKENRLAAMIAVLGGPSENLDVDNFKAEPLKLPELKGKALFTSPDTPDTPKQKKNVTFSESLTSTKLFDKEENPSTVSSSLVPNTTPLSTLTFGGSSTTSVTKLDFGSPIVSNSAPVSLNFGSPLSAVKTTPTNQHDLNKTTSPATANALPNTESGLFSFQINKTSTAVTTSPTTSLVSSSIDDSKPPALTFASSNSLQSNKENTPTQPASTAAPMFSFGSDSKTSQATANTSITSIFASANAEKSPPSSTDSNKIEKNKASFSLTLSKDPSNDNKQMINGFTPNMGSPFALNAPVSQANTNKLGFPSFGSTTTSSLPASQAAPMFSFGSAPQSTALSTPQSTGASVTTAPQPIAVSSNNQSTGMFAAQSKPSMFNINSATPTQNSVFGNTAQVGEPFKTQLSSSTPTAAQGSSIFGSTTQASIFGNVSSSNTPSTTSGMTQNGSLFGDSKPSVFGTGGIVPTAQTNSIFGSSNATSQGNSVFGNAASPASTLFGKPTAAQTGTSFGNTTANTNTQSTSLFSSSTGQTSDFSNQNSQPTKSMFSTTTAAPTFGALGNTSVHSFGAQKESATFGGQSSAPAFAFGSQTNGSVPSFGSQSNPSPAPTFGGQSKSPAPTFGSQANTPAPTFGSQANTPAPNFGSQANTPAPTFGSQANTPAPTFGSQAITSGPTFGSQSNTSAPTFGSQSSTTAPTFGSQANTSATTFGSQTNTPAPAFGNQIIKPAPTFGGQNNSAPPAFGSQTNSAPSFNSQNNTSQVGFGSPGTFNLSATNPNEVKPSTFAFGSNKEPTKPFGASGPFSFGPSAQTPATNAAAPAPSFGAPSASPAFGASQQPPTFNASATQPTGPVFAFGQAAPSPTFQFNATAPQPVAGGGMFSIGSGTAAPRSKTGTNRRRHKLT